MRRANDTLGVVLRRSRHVYLKAVGGKRCDEQRARERGNERPGLRRGGLILGDHSKRDTRC